jgi:hypothetical protein
MQVRHQAAESIRAHSRQLHASISVAVLCRHTEKAAAACTQCCSVCIIGCSVMLEAAIDKLEVQLL